MRREMKEAEWGLMRQEFAERMEEWSEIIRVGLMKTATFTFFYFFFTKT
jgi:hypothetical protein